MSRQQAAEVVALQPDTGQSGVVVCAGVTASPGHTGQAPLQLPRAAAPAVQARHGQAHLHTTTLTAILLSLSHLAAQHLLHQHRDAATEPGGRLHLNRTVQNIAQCSK